MSSSFLYWAETPHPLNSDPSKDRFVNAWPLSWPILRRYSGSRHSLILLLIINHKLFLERNKVLFLHTGMHGMKRNIFSQNRYVLLPTTSWLQRGDKHTQRSDGMIWLDKSILSLSACIIICHHGTSFMMVTRDLSDSNLIDACHRDSVISLINRSVHGNTFARTYLFSLTYFARLAAYIRLGILSVTIVLLVWSTSKKSAAEKDVVLDRSEMDTGGFFLITE